MWNDSETRQDALEKHKLTPISHQISSRDLVRNAGQKSEDSLDGGRKMPTADLGGFLPFPNGFCEVSWKTALRDLLIALYGDRQSIPTPVDTPQEKHKIVKKPPVPSLLNPN